MTNSTKISKWLWPVAMAFLCFSLGTASGLLTIKSVSTWYPPLLKPPGTPPPWVFGPVWSILYVMMGVAVGRLIFLKDFKSVKLFAAQFILNLMWTPIFFVAHYTVVALVVIISMWVLLLFTILFAKKVDGIAALLLVPYLMWVTYATYLNAGIVALN